MTLEEAWYKLLEFDNYDNLTPSQVYSIISDYGVFTSFPKLRIAVKTALQYGLWEQVYSQSNAVSIAQLRSKLENDGFADKIIDEIIASFYSEKQKSEYKQNQSQKSSNKRSESNNSSQASKYLKQYKFPFDIRKCSETNIMCDLPNLSSQMHSLNSMLYISPGLNSEFNVTINELYLSEKQYDESDFYSRYCQPKDSLSLCLTYNITGTLNRSPSLGPYSEIIRFALFVVDVNGRIHSKEYITSINLYEKYALSSGVSNINLDLPVTEISKIVVIPEIGDVDFIGARPINNFGLTSHTIDVKKFVPLNCKVVVEDTRSSYSYCDIELSNFQLWGYDKSISICFLVKGKSRNGSGFSLVNTYVLAFFNETGNLIDTQHISIGKKGYVGPRGGLHDTYMFAGKIKFEHLKYLDLKCSVQSIAKVIVSGPNMY